MTGSGAGLLSGRSALKALWCSVRRYYQGKNRRQSTACGLTMSCYRARGDRVLEIALDSISSDCLKLYLSSIKQLIEGADLARWLIFVCEC